MSYLSKKGFIHHDLAARNILLDKRWRCKVCVHARVCPRACVCVRVCNLVAVAEAAERVGQKGGSSAANRSGIRKAKNIAFTHR